MAMLLSLLSQVSFTFAFIFLCFEIGEKIKNLFHQIDCAMEETNWYRFPIEMQRMLPTIVNLIQDPVILYGFGGIQCNRNQFKKV